MDNMQSQDLALHCSALRGKNAFILFLIKYQAVFLPPSTTNACKNKSAIRGLTNNRTTQSLRHYNILIRLMYEAV